MDYTEQYEIMKWSRGHWSSCHGTLTDSRQSAHLKAAELSRKFPKSQFGVRMIRTMPEEMIKALKKAKADMGQKW